jgi:hypothetical protein
MVAIDDSKSEIISFLEGTLERFLGKFGLPNSVGVYCCPWAGWISLNFNLTKQLESTKNNCPDFEFVEYALLDMSIWAQEYQKDYPEFTLGGTNPFDRLDLDDEPINGVIFDFLKEIIIHMKPTLRFPILLQMLDSLYAEVL